jgi:hypothetical protein
MITKKIKSKCHGNHNGGILLVNHTLRYSINHKISHCSTLYDELFPLMLDHQLMNHKVKDTPRSIAKAPAHQQASFHNSNNSQTTQSNNDSDTRIQKPPLPRPTPFLKRVTYIYSTKANASRRCTSLYATCHLLSLPNADVYNSRIRYSQRIKNPKLFSNAHCSTPSPHYPPVHSSSSRPRSSRSSTHHHSVSG